MKITQIELIEVELVSGHFVVPSGNGLGVTLDEDAIAHRMSRFRRDARDVGFPG